MLSRHDQPLPEVLVASAVYWVSLAQGSRGLPGPPQLPRGLSGYSRGPHLHWTWAGSGARGDQLGTWFDLPRVNFDPP